MKAIDRVFTYLKHKNIPHTRFEKDIGLSNGYLRAMQKRKSDLGESTIVSIVENCLDLNSEWLLFGRGEMIKEKNKTKDNKQKGMTYFLLDNMDDDKEVMSEVSGEVSGESKGTEALHSCQNEVSRLEGLLAEKEELIKELRARITDKEDMVSMLKNQLKAHESTPNEQSEADNMRQTG